MCRPGTSAVESWSCCSRVWVNGLMEAPAPKGAERCTGNFAELARRTTCISCGTQAQEDGYLMLEAVSGGLHPAAGKSLRQLTSAECSLLVKLGQWPAQVERENLMGWLPFELRMGGWRLEDDEWQMVERAAHAADCEVAK
mmetsp:Transcript_130035/g.253280  ORF Transcript_130035/g.253280 Transcript_130035/m.253280 type:complete len:141 (+) Transcript_130035:44-466(+)